MKLMLNSTTGQNQPCNNLANISLIFLTKPMRGNILVTVTLCSSWAGLRQTAHTMLPLLESREETQPYAAWLAAQMDYLNVTDEIRITVPAPKVETNQPPPPMANPPSQTEREIWARRISGRPGPPS